MNNEELNVCLNEMDEEERRLTLEADDACDRLYAYKLHKDFGVNVVCNPEGDRTKIMIDGVVMNQMEFMNWLNNKVMEKNKANTNNTYTPETLPAELDIDREALSEVIGNDLIDANDVALENGVRNYLREKYDHYLARGCELDIEAHPTHISVRHIAWGRKR